MQFMRRKALALAIAALPFAAHANPQGGQIVAGSAVIRKETPTKLGITQTSDKAIIDWKSFSIGKNEHTQFYQPSANSVTLNRVVGEDPSQILGRLTANGRVFLVNPNGIFFGKDAQIDVAGLVASTHNIRNEDFLAGRYNFNIPGKPGAAVINEGTIRIADTGIAAFVAPSVANRGIIAARLGKVALAAANGFTLDFYGDNLVSFLVADELAQTAFDIEGKQLTSFVENSGRIEAQGGYVLLTAKVAEGVVQSVINQSGSIEATTVGTHKGEIILNAGKGSLAVAGSIDASAPDGGDGGFIETSGGYVAIDPATRITTAAPFGSTGRWLIDPTDYVVAASGGNITGATLAGYLTGNNVEIQTLTTGSGNGDIFVNDAVTWNTTNKLTLTAYRDININQHINAAGGGSIKLRADSTARGIGTVAIGGSGRSTVNNGASVGIYYNPASYTDTATRSDTTGNPYGSKITRNTGSTFIAYMLVNDVNQLQAMKDRPTGRYALGKNIDASATAGWNGGKGFIPVGTSTQTFSGTFFGDDHVINGLTINDSSLGAAGLFGVIGSFGKVSHVGLTGGNIISSEAGILAGRNFGTVTKAFAVGSVIGSSAGGLTGRNWGTISLAYSAGTVSGIDGGSVGGLTSTNEGSISDSFSTSAVSLRFLSCGNLCTQGAIGGLVSSHLAGSLTNTYATGLLTINGSLSPNWNGLYNGGIGTTTSSYWNMETTGQSGSTGGTGKTTVQMKQAATFAGWDFTNVWRINEGTSYPYLAWAASTTVEARQLLQPSGSASSAGSSVGATTKVVTDICSVAPVVCRPELAPIPPRVEIKSPESHPNNSATKRLDELVDQVNEIAWAKYADKAIGPSVRMFYTGMAKLLANDRLKQILGTEMAEHFQNILKANLTNVLKRIKANPTQLGFNMLLSLAIDDLKVQIGADGNSSSFAAVYKDLLVDLIKETLSTAYDAAVAGKSPATFQLALATSATIRISAFTAQKAFKVGQATAKLSAAKKYVVTQSSDSLYYYIQTQNKANLAEASGYPDRAAKLNRDAAQLVDRTAGNLASSFGFDRARTTAVLRTMAEASKLAATGDAAGARSLVQSALDIAKHEDGLVTNPLNISMGDYVRNMESSWVRVL